MGVDWLRVTLGESSVTLIDCMHKTPAKQDSGLPYLAIPQMKTGSINLADARMISEEDFETWTQKADPQPHDVVLSRRCNPGVTAPVRPGLRFALGQNLVLLRADGSKVFPPFLRWLVSSQEWWEEVDKFINVGAVFDSLRCGDVPKFALRCPPLPEQRRIAAVLGALDDKIELNRKMNQTLEEMAQALFKSWFIDFDGHDDFVESELGPIPRGWDVRSLEQIAHYLNGTACQKFRPREDEPDLPVIKIREMNQGITEQTDRAKATIPLKWHVFDGDVLFSWSGSLLVKIWTEGPGALNQHLFKVTSDAFPRWLYYLWTTHHLREFQRIAAAKATTMGHIKRHHLTEAKCVVPSPVEIGSFGETISGLIDRAVSNSLQSRTLTQLRDTLLPKLISGEVRVPEVEHAVEAAL